MKYISTAIIILMGAFLILGGCTKEDAIPYYQYFGETAGETEQADLETDVDVVDVGVEKVNYTVLDVACPIPPNRKEFIDSLSHFKDYWQQWCKTYKVPAIDFDHRFLAYYSATTTGCSKMEVQGVVVKDNELVIIIEKGSYPQECPCTRDLRQWNFYIVVDRVEGVTPTFKETETEMPCWTPGQ